MLMTFVENISFWRQHPLSKKDWITITHLSPTQANCNPYIRGGKSDLMFQLECCGVEGPKDWQKSVYNKVLFYFSLIIPILWYCVKRIFHHSNCLRYLSKDILKKMRIFQKYIWPKQRFQHDFSANTELGVGSKDTEYKIPSSCCKWERIASFQIFIFSFILGFIFFILVLHYLSSFYIKYTSCCE